MIPQDIYEIIVVVKEPMGDQLGVRSVDAGVRIPVSEKEKPQEYRPFTDKEREALRRDGAIFYVLSGKETIMAQVNANRFFRNIINTVGTGPVWKLQAINAEVAIYPDPRDFFIPDSGNKSLPEQEELTKKDTKELRKRTGLGKDIVEIIPDAASTLTELTFRHLDKTTGKGQPVWLFGKEYASVYGLDWVHGRIKNPVGGSDSYVVGVGGAETAGIQVVTWGSGEKNEHLRVVRLVVAKKK